MDFESAMQTFAEAWMAANRGGRILIPTENQPKIQDSNGSGNGGKTEEEENNSKNGDDERVSLNFSSNYRFKIYEKSKYFLTFQITTSSKSLLT